MKSKRGPFFKLKVNGMQAKALLDVMLKSGAGSHLDYRQKFALTVVMDDLRTIIKKAERQNDSKRKEDLSKSIRRHY